MLLCFYSPFICHSHSFKELKIHGEYEKCAFVIGISRRSSIFITRDFNYERFFPTPSTQKSLAVNFRMSNVKKLTYYFSRKRIRWTERRRKKKRSSISRELVNRWARISLLFCWRKLSIQQHVASVNMSWTYLLLFARWTILDFDENLLMLMIESKFWYSTQMRRDMHLANQQNKSHWINIHKSFVWMKKLELY